MRPGVLRTHYRAGSRGRPDLFILGLALCIAGCRPPARPSVPPPAAPANVPAARPPTGDGARVSSESAGPVRLGMTSEEAARLPGLAASETHLQLEGESYPALLLNRGAQPVALAELKDGKVWRVRVLDPALRTAAGAGLGTSASQLQKLYGPGRLGTGEGNVCATFTKAPGLSFCFAPGTGPQIKTWNDVVK